MTVSDSERKGLAHSQGKLRRHNPQLTWPIVLILVGSVLLLNQLGILSLSWSRLWSLWPLVLILAGLEILLARSRVGTVAFLVLACILTIVGLRVVPSVSVGLGTPDLEHFDYGAKGLESATVRIELGAGELYVSSLGDSAHLYEAEIHYNQLRTEVSSSEMRDGDHVQVILKSRHLGVTPAGVQALDKWRVRLNAGIPMRLGVSSGVNRSTLDLEGLSLTRLDLRMGVGDVALVLSRDGPYDAYVDGGIGRLDIEIPLGTEVRVRVDGGLGKVDVADRLQRHEGYYVTPGYDASSDAIDLDIDGGIGVITIR